MADVQWTGGVEHWTQKGDGKHMVLEMERWGKVVKETGIKLE